MSESMLAPPHPPQPRGERAGPAGAARGGLANLAGAGVAGAAGVGVTWLVARGLGPVAAGSFFAATSAFVLFCSVARLGTSTALVYWPARLRAALFLPVGAMSEALLAVTRGTGVYAIGLRLLHRRPAQSRRPFGNETLGDFVYANRLHGAVSG